MHTQRGGQIKSMQLQKQIEEIINIKKPSKMKLLRILLSLLKNFFSSLYFFFLLFFAYLVKLWYFKMKSMQLKPEEVQKIKIL